MGLPRTRWRVGRAAGDIRALAVVSRTSAGTAGLVVTLAWFPSSAHPVLVQSEGRVPQEGPQGNRRGVRVPCRSKAQFTFAQADFRWRETTFAGKTQLMMPARV